MAYASPRSVVAELRTGAVEGSHAGIGKDWGGPRDSRSDAPVPPGAYETYGELLDRAV